MRHSLWVLLAIIALTSQALAGSTADATGTSEPAATESVRTAAPAVSQVYRISSGDILSITTWGDDHFTLDCQVNGQGSISFLELGDVPVAGMTCSEAKDRLEQGLRAYLKRPHVAVAVKQYGVPGTSVYVLGEVGKPGVYPIASTGGVMEALAAAGGPTLNASGQITVLKARTGEFRTIGLIKAASTTKLSPEAGLEPGDVVMVDRKKEADEPGRYSVIGEVPTPGMFDMPVTAPVYVLDAMQKAGMLTTNPGETPGMHTSVLDELSRTADFEHCLLTRGKVVIPLNLTALLRGDASQNLVLQSGDVITVPRRAVITVYAMGEVKTPGRQMLPPNSTVLDLLNSVNGVMPSAKLEDAALVRIVNGKPVSVPVDLDRLLKKADPKNNPQLQEADVLFVPSRVARDRNSLLDWVPYVPYWLHGW